MLFEKSKKLLNSNNIDKDNELGEEIKEEIATEISKNFVKEQGEITKLLEEEETKTTRIEGKEKKDTIELFLEKEKQLENISNEWINKQREDLNRISKGFGFSETFVEETIDLLKKFFKNEIQKIKTKDMIRLKGMSIVNIQIIREILKQSEKSENNEKIKETMREMEIEWLLEENKTKELIDFIDSFSKKDLFDLLIKKFQGQKITDKEKRLLHFFIVQDSEYWEKAKAGSFVWLTGEIKLSLLNPDSDTATLIHEFTHKCLYELLKKTNVKIREINLNRKLSKQLMIEIKQETEVKNEDKKKGQDWFFKAEKALNESLAHKMSTYYDFQKKLSFESYKDETSPELFKEIYDSINSATKEKSLKEFCEIAKDWYLSFAKKWDINLTAADTEKVIQDLKKQIKNSK